MTISHIITTISDLSQSGIAHGIVLFWIVSAAVRALPKPKEASSDFYLWFFRFTHIMLTNFELAKLGRKGDPDANR